MLHHQTRGGLAAALLLISSCPAAVNARSPAECLRTLSGELARAASCGDSGSLNYCLSYLASDDSPVEPAMAPYDDANKEALISGLRGCFSSAGCTDEEAAVEAEWTVRRCEEDEETGELRRRKRMSIEGRSDDEEKDGVVERVVVDMGIVPGVLARAAAYPFTAYLAARTTTTTTTSSSSSSTSSSSSASSTIGTSTTASIPSTCLTTSPYYNAICPTQSTGSNSGKLLSCYSTKLTASLCADGLLCRTSTTTSTVTTTHGTTIATKAIASDVVSCMYEDNTIPLAGTILLSVFGGAVFVWAVLIVWCCAKDRKEQKRLRRNAEAAALLREKNAAAAGRMMRQHSVPEDGDEVANTGLLAAQAEEEERAAAAASAAVQYYGSNGGGGQMYVGREPSADGRRGLMDASPMVTPTPPEEEDEGNHGYQYGHQRNGSQPQEGGNPFGEYQSGLR